MKFEWDPAKAARNLDKHGVSLEEAASAFGDPLSLTIIDPDHASDEDRFILVGQARSGRLLVVVHSDRAGATRLISARTATPRERRDYEQERPA